jgi:four helix bundle protein
MTKIKNKFDLEERTTNFGIAVVNFCQKLDKNFINNPLISQVVRSSGSIGANYREANDPLGKKDFLHKLRISRREAKEALHWLELLETTVQEEKPEIKTLKQEAKELTYIFTSIINKCE